MNQPQSTPRPSDRWIPWYIAAFFVVLTLTLVPMCIIAVRTNTGVVTENAYEKGIAYNKIIQAEEQQDSLKWQGGLSVTPASGKAMMDFRLKDASGKPLDKAAVKLWLVRPAQGGMDQQATMQDHGDGAYQAEIQLPQRGLWEARVSATLDGHNYQVVKRIVIP